MVEDNIDLGFIAKLLQKNNEEFRGLRREVADIRTLCVQTYDYVKRTDRHHFEMRDDLELMIKMEVGGAIAHVHTVFEHATASLEGKVDDLSERVDALSGRVDNLSDRVGDLSGRMLAVENKL